MILIVVATFAFFIFFGTLVQRVFDCTFDTALNASACVTGLGLAAFAALM